MTENNQLSRRGFLIATGAAIAAGAGIFKTVEREIEKQNIEQREEFDGILDRNLLDVIKDPSKTSDFIVKDLPTNYSSVFGNALPGFNDSPVQKSLRDKKVTLLDTTSYLPNKLSNMTRMWEIYKKKGRFDVLYSSTGENHIYLDQSAIDKMKVSDLLPALISLNVRMIKEEYPSQEYDPDRSSPFLSPNVREDTSRMVGNINKVTTSGFSVTLLGDGGEIRFNNLNQAFCVLAASWVRDGVKPDALPGNSSNNRPEANFLAELMKQKGITVKDAWNLYRNSNLTEFMKLILPESTPGSDADMKNAYLSLHTICDQVQQEQIPWNQALTGYLNTSYQKSKTTV